MFQAVVQSVLNDQPCFIHQILRLPYIDKASGHNVRTGKKLSAVFLKGENDNQNTILGQMLSVPKDNVTDITDSESVNHNLARLNLTGHPG